MKQNLNTIITERRVQLRHKLLLLFIVFSMIPLFFSSRAIFIGFMQTTDKSQKVIKKLTFDNEPVEIVNMKNSQKSFNLDEKFKQETDWLKDFTMKFKNNSDKPITYMRVEIDFPETKSSGNIMSFPLSYGTSPLFAIKKEVVTSIKPSENVELHFSEKQYNSLKTFIETRHLIDSLTKVDVRIVFVLFEDGTGWSTGHLIEPDPNNPKKFIPTPLKI